ncbi:hypothetical protein MLD52_04015 [Puniceicoccaceae bacterium K14]|nr:hypothetical protein [Puniceicoccaceae bacterium K14]
MEVSQILQRSFALRMIVFFLLSAFPAFAQIPDAGFFGTTVINVRYSGKDKLQFFVDRPGIVSADVVARNASGELVGNPSVTLVFERSQELLIEELPDGEEITITYSGTFKESNDGPEIPFELTTSGEMGPITGSARRGSFPNDTLVWDGDHTILDRVSIPEGVTLDIRPGSLVHSLRPDSSLTRGDILLSGGNLIAEGVIFENLDELASSRQGEDDPAPTATLKDCGFFSSDFEMDVTFSGYEVSADNLFEHDIFAYEFRVVTSAAEFVATGESLFLVLLEGDSISGRVFGTTGEELFEVLNVSTSRSDELERVASGDPLRTLSVLEKRQLITRLVIFDFGQSIGDFTTIGTDFRFTDIGDLNFKGHTLPRSTVFMDLDTGTRVVAENNVLGKLVADPSREGLDDVGGINSTNTVSVAEVNFSSNSFSGFVDTGIFVSQLVADSFTVNDNQIWEGVESSESYSIVFENLQEGGVYQLARNSGVDSITLGDVSDGGAFGVLAESNICDGFEIYGSDNSITNNTVGGFRDTPIGTGIALGSLDPEAEVSAENTFVGNQILGFDKGIEIAFAMDNTFRDNRVLLNRVSLALNGESTQRSAVDNILVNNAFCAIETNLILEGACDSGGCANQYDLGLILAEENIVEGTSSGGNLWDDYEGVDGNEDGIGDTTHTAAAATNGTVHVDRFPLVGECFPLKIVVNTRGNESDANLNDVNADADLTEPGLQTTLRAAIETANLLPGQQVICFDPELGGSMGAEGPFDITDPVTIDGKDSNENAARFEFNIGTSKSLFRFLEDTDGSQLIGIEVGPSSDDDYIAVIGAKEVVIKDCLFATDFGLENAPPTRLAQIAISENGSAVITQCEFAGGVAVEIDNSSGTQIGLQNAADFNLFKGAVIKITGEASTGNQIVNAEFQENEIRDTGFITIDNAPANRIGLEEEGGRNTFLNESLGNAVAYIVVQGSKAQENEITNNRFNDGSSTTGITVDNAAKNIIRKNLFINPFPGLRLTGAGTEETLVQNNEFVNGQIGVLIDGNAHNNTLGGTELEEANEIKNTAVFVGIESGQENSVLGNLYEGEQFQMAVDLAFDENSFAFQNENDDDGNSAANTAPNRLQNKPEFKFVDTDDQERAFGIFRSQGLQEYRIECYHEYGKPPVIRDVTTDVTGIAPFSFPVPSNDVLGPFFFTATDRDGNTSESSVLSLSYIVDTEDDLPDALLANGKNVTASGNRSLRAALSDTNRFGLSDRGVAERTSNHIDAFVFFQISPSDTAIPLIELDTPLPTIDNINLTLGADLSEADRDILATLGGSASDFEVDELVRFRPTATAANAGASFGAALKLVNNSFTLKRLQFEAFPGSGVVAENTTAILSDSGPSGLVPISHRLTVEGCRFFDMGENGLESTAFETLIGGDTQELGDFPGNIMARNGASGIQITAVQELIEIRGNIIGGSNLGEANQVRGITLDNGAFLIENNLIAFNNGPGIRIDGPSAFDSQLPVDYMLRNNEIANNTGQGIDLFSGFAHFRGNSIHFDGRVEPGEGIRVTSPFPPSPPPVIQSVTRAGDKLVLDLELEVVRDPRLANFAIATECIVEVFESIPRSGAQETCATGKRHIGTIILEHGEGELQATATIDAPEDLLESSLISATLTSRVSATTAFSNCVSLGDADGDGSPDSEDPAPTDPTISAIRGFDGFNAITPLVTFKSSGNSGAGVTSTFVSSETIAEGLANFGLTTPERAELLAGLFNINAIVSPPGSSIQIRIQIPDSLPHRPNAYFKVQLQENDFVFEAYELAEITEEDFIITLVDGGSGDLDGVANGIIVDPGAMVFDPDLVVATPGDADGDGLPNEFELEFFGNETSANPNDDSDKDGFTELEEFVMGTDPTDPLSSLRLSIKLDEKIVHISLASNLGRLYILKGSEDLIEFTEIEIKEGTGEEIVFSLSLEEYRRFFQIGVELSN